MSNPPVIVALAKYGVSMMIVPSSEDPLDLKCANAVGAVVHQANVVAPEVSRVMELLPRAEFFDISGAEHEREWVENRAKNAPWTDALRERFSYSLSPPFPIYWMECALPAAAGRNPLLKVGVLVVDALQGGDPEGRFVNAFEGTFFSEPIGFILALTVFETSSAHRGAGMWPFKVAIAVGKEGSFLGMRILYPPLPTVEKFIDLGYPSWETIREMYWTIAPVLEAHRILSCRNVTTRPAPPLPRKQAAATTHLVPRGILFKTIVVGDRIVREGAKSSVDPSDETYIPLHIVRGHMVRYGAERPLFGKYIGNFYRKPHTRGTREAGEVKKTYKVEDPSKDLFAGLEADTGPSESSP